MSTLGPRPSSSARSVPTPAQADVAAVLDEASGAGRGPLTVTELAELTGQHPNTLREHLASLIELGLAQRTTQTPSGRGRPTYVYFATRSPDAEAHASLVTALTSHLRATSRRPGETAEALGRATAEAGRDYPGTMHGVSAMVASLNEWGFAVTDDQAGLRLTQCPLLDVAREDPEVVCGFHRGLTRGLASAAGLDPDELELLPFHEPGACRVRLPLAE